MKKIFIFCLFLNLLFCEETKKILVESGFYDRENEIVRVEIDFGKEIDINSLKLLEKDKKVDFYFIAKENFKGDLYFIVDKLPSLTSKEYILYFNPGKWEKKAIGNEEIYYKKSSLNLIPNPGFEKIKEDKPVDWTLQDYPWSYRELSNIKSFCRLTTEDKFEGERSLKLSSEIRDDKFIPGFASSSIFPLKPKTKYKLSYKLKVTKVNKEKLQTHSAVIVEVQLLNEKKERIYPKDYSINRILCAYNLSRNLPDEYLNKWIENFVVQETAEEVRYGLVWISFWQVEAEYFIDDLSLIEVEAKEPMKIKVVD
ncbi:MAG: hypothetical protein NC922_08725 [Candidatus Omnitrophica bacterium]|nr:hypothetical protein [Candidatus Omnitrophota bacterium]